MSDLISKEKIRHEIAMLIMNNNRLIDTWLANCIDDIIDEQPTIEAEPVKHGRWLIHNILDYAKRPTGRKVGECSVCGQLTPDFRLITEEPKWNYCPNCGARMFDNDIDVPDKNVGKMDEVEE